MTTIIALLLLFGLLILAAIQLDTPQGRTLLRRFAWFRRFEQLPAHERHHRGTVALGLGVCCFAALLTLKLFEPAPRWLGTMLAIATVVLITAAAGLYSSAEE